MAFSKVVGMFEVASTTQRLEIEKSTSSDVEWFARTALHFTHMNTFLLYNKNCTPSMHIAGRSGRTVGFY